MESTLANKVDKVDGKGLSTNDYTDADKAIVGGVTAALAGKQGALTAGKYIDIDANNEISVDRVVPNEAFTYRIYGGNGTITVDKIVNNVVVHTETHSTGEFDPPITYDNAITVTYYNAGSMKYELLIASDSHEVGYIQTWAWWAFVDYTETFSTVDHTGEKLIIKSEMDTALAGKQDTLTFDNAPTDGSNNPVKSDGIYDALAGKQDIFERISYANWQLLTPQQQAAKPYYIYDYPNSGTVQAANVAYSNTSSGLSATTAQGGIDELASEKQDKTDNNLTTTNKTVVGGINELKSGLTNVNSGYLSKQFVVINGTSIYDFVRNANTPTGYIVADVQLATDNPVPNSTSFAIIYKPIANGNYSIVKIEKGSQLFISGVLLPSDTEYTFTEFAKKSDLTNVESRLVCTEIVYDDSASLFTLPAGVSKPKDGAQIMVCGRNRSTGAIYALWFDNSASGFKIGKILDGSAPADGTSISVQYIA